MTNRYAHVIFCDDIRHEAGGKVTLVGAYGDALMVPYFPITLPKLCARLDIVSPSVQPLESVDISFHLNENNIGGLKLSSEQIATTPAESSFVGDDDTIEEAVTIRAEFIFSPFMLEKPGYLMVRVMTERGELKVLQLKIDKVS